MKNIFIKNKKKSQAGVTLIEVLIGVGIVSFVVFSIYSTLMGLVSASGDTKQRIGAIALANEKMEIIRNLPYENIGVIDGIVNGPIVAEETINKNGFNYGVKIDIRYVDDPFDGLSPADLVPTDYKQAQVQVIWQNSGNDKMITFFSNFVPNGIETNVGGGTLSVNTVTSGGVLVPGVTIRIESLDNNPLVNYETVTNDQGSLILPGVPAQNYRFYASKNDYENLQTYPNPPESAFVPIEKDLYVSEGAINPLTFIIEETADLKIIANNVTDDSLIEGINFEISGGRKIGTAPDTFNFSETDSTNSSGEINYSNLSPGSYTIINYDSLSNEDFKLIGSESGSLFQLSSGATEEINFIFADRDINSLFVSVIDNISKEPISGAVVQLIGEDFDQTLITGSSGQVFFPMKTDPETIMEADDYELSVNFDGYQDKSETIYINDLTETNIYLDVL